MFTIYGGKTEFKQWEQGQRVTNPKLAVGDKVRFWNQSGETHPMIAYKHEGVVVADVPNDLLQHCSPILVELCGDPECMCRFLVTAQDKPADYVFIDNTHCEPAVPSGGGGGVTDYNKLENRPCSLEFSGETLFHETVDLSEPVMLQNAIGLIAGETYTIICNDRLYEVVAAELDTEGMIVGAQLGFGTVLVMDIYAEYQEMVGVAAVISLTSETGNIAFDIKIVHGVAVVKPLSTLLLPRIDVTFTNNGDNTYSADKSFEDVGSAILRGYDVKACITSGGSIFDNLTLTTFSDEVITFMCLKSFDLITNTCDGVYVSWNRRRLAVNKLSGTTT